MLILLTILFYPLPALLTVLINYIVGLKVKIKAGEEKIFPLILNLALVAVLGPIQAFLFNFPFCMSYEGSTGCASYHKDILSQLIMPGIIIYIIMFIVGLLFFKFGRAYASVSSNKKTP